MEARSAVANGVVGQVGSLRAGRERAGTPRRFAGRAQQLEAETVALRRHVAEAEAEEERVTAEVEALREERRVLMDRCEKIGGFIMGWSSKFRVRLASTTGRSAAAVRFDRLHGVEQHSMACGEQSSQEARMKEAQHTHDIARKELEEALHSKKEAEAYLENLRFDVSMLREECERNATSLTIRTGTCHTLPGALGRGCGASRFRWVARVDDETVVQCRPEDDTTRISTIRVSHIASAVEGGSVAGDTDVASVGCSSVCTNKPSASYKQQQQQQDGPEIEPGDFELPCELVGAGIGTCVVTIHRYPIAADERSVSKGGAGSDVGDGSADGIYYRRALAGTTLIGVPLPECPARELPYEAFMVTVVDGPLQLPDDVGSERTLTPRLARGDSKRTNDSWWSAVPQGKGMGPELIRAQFRRLDERGVGTITQQELAHVLQALDAREWTDRRIERLLRATNARVNGRVKYEAFLAWLFGGTPDTASNGTPRSSAIGCGEDGAACAATRADAHCVVSSALLGGAPPENPVVH